MLPRVDTTGPRPPASANTPSPPIPVTQVKPVEPAAGASGESYARLTRLALGKEFQASLLSRLADGSFLVKLASPEAGAMLRMNLPAGMQAGDALKMTLVSLEPRPTFLLASAAGQGSAQAELSNTGRLIDHFLQSARGQGMPAALIGRTPLLASSLVAAAPLAAALHDAIGTSGLFYESHVAQWAAGRLALAEVLREPQARMGIPVPGTAPGGNAAQSNAASLSATAAALALPPADEAAGASMTAQPADALLPAAAQDRPELARLVSLQLNALEQHGATWRGEVWPGQFMEWEIGEELPQHTSQEQEPAERTWHSSVRFELPALGMVAASVRLCGTHLQVQLRTADAGSAATLRTHFPALAEALEAAGSKPDLLTVRQDETL